MSDMSRVLKTTDRTRANALLTEAAEKYATSLQWNANNPQVRQAFWMLKIATLCMGNTQVYFVSAWKMTKSSTCRMRCVYQSSVPPYAAWAQVELAIPPPENLIRQAACWRDLQHLLCLLFLTSPDAVYLISKLPCRSLDAVCLLHWVTPIGIFQEYGALYQMRYCQCRR